MGGRKWVKLCINDSAAANTSAVLEVIKYIQELHRYFYSENKFLWELGNMESHVSQIEQCIKKIV